MDTFTLRIHVTGLGLFVPDPVPCDELQPAMHLLLPRVPGSPGGRHGKGGRTADPKHVARLNFDPDDAPEHTGLPFLEMDGFGWTAPVSGTPSVDPWIPDEVIRITKDASNWAKIPYAQLKRAKQFQVSSHLVLGDGGIRRCSVPRVEFTVGEAEEARNVFSTNHLIWEIPDLPREDFDIVRQPLRDSPEEETRRLKIRPRGPEVVLDLLNLPEDEHDLMGADESEPSCDRGMPNHFSAYDRLFRSGATKRARCVEGSYREGDCPKAPWDVQKAKVIYTCMLATAELDFQDA